ncbi:MAG: hypothetical protein RID09_09770 [Coleofasciculus sp. G1-WW12-02]|uniref:hypothetical protein n=1 Tax=Coleofasciculus sp. G1-WW12-02 TaxID=3068483 RepID=UPI0032FD572B
MTMFTKLLNPPLQGLQVFKGWCQGSDRIHDSLIVLAFRVFFFSPDQDKAFSVNCSGEYSDVEPVI